MKRTTLLKRIILICLVMLFVMPMTSCKRQPSTVDKMLDYMHNKYDDTFTYENSFDSGFHEEEKWIRVKSEKHPDWDVRVYYSAWYGTEEIDDNYLFLKFEEQTQSRLQRIAESTFGCEVKTSVAKSMRTAGNTMTDNTTFEEFFTSYQSNITASVMVHCSYGKIDKTVVEKAIEENFVENREFVGLIRFSENIEQFDKWNSLPAMELSNMPSVQFVINKSGEIDEFSWRNVEE